MKILFCGDIVGRSGREAVIKHIPALRREMSIDAIIVNGENAASGFGITPKLCDKLFAAKVDVISCGDHSWDREELRAYLSSDNRILRPINFPRKNTIGSGKTIIELSNGKKILVIHALGQVFHKENLNCPFAAVEEAIEEYRLGINIDAIFVEIHAEATSEKNAMGIYLDGRVSAVIGSHTHIPTADYRILPKGTAYQTDAGMCGDYNSVIGFDSSTPIERFITKISKTKERMKPALEEATLCATIVDIDDKTGLAKNIQTIRMGGALTQKDN